MNGIRIIGIGSYDGDDQLGWQVLACLRDHHAWPTQSLLCCTSPTALLAHLAGVRELILVDAVRSGAQAGTLFHLTWPQCKTTVWPAASLSVHSLSVIQALQLADTLQLLPKKVHIYGIELDVRQRGLAMSSPVQQAACELAKALDETFNRHDGRQHETAEAKMPQSAKTVTGI